MARKSFVSTFFLKWLEVFILSLKLKPKPVKNNPLRAKVAIWEPKDKLNKFIINLNVFNKYLRKIKVLILKG